MIRYPADWQVKKLLEVGEIVTGNTPSKKHPEYYGGKIPWVKPNDLDKSGAIFKTDKYLSQKGANEARILPKDTVMVSCIGNLGKVGIAGTSLATNQQINSIIFNEKIYPIFGFYACRRLQKVLEHYAPATTLPIITKSRFSELKIPVPPITVQRKIASILEKAESAREKRREANRLTDEFLKSAFIEMFGDPIRNSKNWAKDKMSNLGTVDRGVSKRRPRNAPELLGGPYPLIQTGNVANSHIYIKKYYQSYSEIGLKQSKMWPVGTLCITIAANIAKTGILTFEACFPDSVVGFLPNKKVKTEYIHFYFVFYQKILEDLAPESAQKNINLQILRNLNIPVPPIPLQQKFAELVQKVEKLKEKQRKSEKELNNLFNSLMQRAFKGEIV